MSPYTPEQLKTIAKDMEDAFLKKQDINGLCGLYDQLSPCGLNNNNVKKMLEVITCSHQMSDFLFQMEYHGYKSLESIKKNINEPFVTMAIIVAYSAGEFKACQPV
jgi:hypothetical protein